MVTYRCIEFHFQNFKQWPSENVGKHCCKSMRKAPATVHQLCHYIRNIVWCRLFLETNRITFIRALEHGIHLPDVSGGLLCLTKSGLLSELNALHTYWNCKSWKTSMAGNSGTQSKDSWGHQVEGVFTGYAVKIINIWELFMSQYHLIKNVGLIYNNSSKIKHFL